MARLKRTLDQWLNYQETLHHQNIDLTLARVSLVYRRLFKEKPPFLVITVAGTNGKGSTLAFLEQAYCHAGYAVGLFTSPHLFSYNERVRIQQKNIDDASLCLAFEAIEASRKTVTLTYFEFSFLAALIIFKAKKIDIALLEVGLGGRLDAANVIDCHCALITNIALDHTEYLGTTRAQIALEKAAIARADSPLICADPKPPKNLRVLVNRHRQGFFVTKGYQGKLGLAGAHQKLNAALAEKAIEMMPLPVSKQVIASAFAKTSLVGRIQRCCYRRKNFLLDVAHNAAGASALAAFLAENPQPTVAIFAALKDKDSQKMAEKIKPWLDYWLLVPLKVTRANSVEELKDCIQTQAHTVCISIADALERAVAMPQSRVLVFGSFYTVAQCLEVINDG